MRRSLLLTLFVATLFAADEYPLGPDSQRQSNLPQGKIEHFTFASSKVYPGATRDYWLYVPAQYDAAKPACVFIFQDGNFYYKESSQWRATIVMDNLIAQKSIPVSIAIFVDPGVLHAALPDTQQDRFNRSFEYDALGDRYATFLADELLPEVAAKYNISKNPDDRLLIGLSSGGIASFNAAFFRPDLAHRVLSTIGSFGDLRGGDAYPVMVRKMEARPLRVFLEDGDHDLNIYAGSWWLANQGMQMALDWAGYEVNFVKGAGGHDSKQAASVFPDALRWLWLNYPTPIAKPRPRADSVIEPESGWQLVGQGYKFTEGPAVDREGNVYFCDVTGNKIYKIGDEGKIAVFKEDSGGASGLMFGPDGHLYAAQNGRKRIVSWSVTDGSEQILAEGVSSNDLAVTSKGDVYFTDPPGHRVWRIPKGGPSQVVYEGMHFPNGIRLSGDESLLVVDDSETRFVWSLAVQPDGSLADAEPFYRLEMIDDGNTGLMQSRADGIAFDTKGWLYVTTRYGIQVCDQPGRVHEIISAPDKPWPSNLVFAGSDMQTLFLTEGDKVWKRHLRRAGYYPWQPFKPEKPSL